MSSQKLLLKNELLLQEESVTNNLLNEPDIEKRQIWNEYRLGLKRIITICKERNKF